MKAFAASRHDELAGAVLCHDVRGAAGMAFRKGHTILPEDLPRLRECPWSELHLLRLDADDLGQREAGERLARALVTSGLRAAPAGHKHVLQATHDGLLEVDAVALQRVNSIDGVAIFTARDQTAVAAGEVVAQAQITPLAIRREAIEEAERIARVAAPTLRGGIVRVIPFTPCKTIIWARDERMVRGATEKLRRFGCAVEVLPLANDVRALMEAQRDAALFVVSGANALDPLDPVFVALEQMGATVQRAGVPVHPGTLLWIARWNATTIIGLPSCGRGTATTAFDLVLPRLLAHGAIGDDDLAALGHGGILR